jgi:hypothetical protein
MKRAILIVGILALLLAMSGCKGKGGYSASQTSGGGAKAAADPKSTSVAKFSEDVQPIFTKKCAHPSCHGQAQSAGMQLTKGMAYDNIVGVKSTEEPQFDRIDPGQPDSSYMVMKLEGKQKVGAQMPLTGGPLPQKDVQTIRSWVKAGAKNN